MIDLCDGKKIDVKEIIKFMRIWINTETSG